MSVWHGIPPAETLEEKCARLVADMLQQVCFARLEEFNERLKRIELLLQPKCTIQPPVYVTLPTSACDTKAWDAAADEALRNFEKQVGE